MSSILLDTGQGRLIATKVGMHYRLTCILDDVSSGRVCWVETWEAVAAALARTPDGYLAVTCA